MAEELGFQYCRRGLDTNSVQITDSAWHSLSAFGYRKETFRVDDVVNGEPPLAHEQKVRRIDFDFASPTRNWR